MKHFSTACLVASLGLVLSPMVQAQTSVKMVLDWAFEGPQSTWTAAAESGCFKQQGLDLSMDRGMGSGDAIAKVASGAYNIGVADFGNVVRYNDANPNNKLTMVFVLYDASPLGVVLLKKSGVKTPKDLEGMRLSGPQGESARVMFPAFAKKTGIDASKVNWVTVTPDLRQATVVKGLADGAAGHMNTVIKGMAALKVPAEEMTIMSYSEHGLDVPGNVVIVKPEWASANKAAVKGVLTCAVAGVKKALDDPKAAVATLKKFNSMVDEANELNNLNFALKSLLVTPGVTKNGFSHIDAARYDEALGAVAEALSVRKPALSEVWSADYLPAAGVLSLKSR
ncbi:ABC transporter substrate-binding protein [Hydrogenophaga sp.]|uniref:ABC transporter substrate-binding protein n=1 Tax=Hydrogenophaga sp. TaxID=1904254 RepID=UPI00271F25BA|nr:ABC transporter substrate-binding protein [Hydrogenophaga sp.]MDO9434202.1 ABC transporter substrate-binding protein [Hydrogenophaga sp.]